MDYWLEKVDLSPIYDMDDLIGWFGFSFYILLLKDTGLPVFTSSSQQSSFLSSDFHFSILVDFFFKVQIVFHRFVP